MTGRQDGHCLLHQRSPLGIVHQGGKHSLMHLRDVMDAVDRVQPHSAELVTGCMGGV